MTKISIVIPTYNGEKNIKKQIETLLNDCKKGNIFNFYEIVICDNCSTDNTKKLVKSLDKKINKNNIISIKCFSSKVNLGYSLNFFQSIKLAKSKYVLFLCDDNIPDKEFYIETYKVFRSENINKLCFFSTNNINNYKKKSNFNFDELPYVLNRGSILSGVLLKRNKIKYKYAIRNGLYPHNGVFLDYYLNYGLKVFNFKSKINCKNNKKLSTHFHDRMNRKSDLAVLDKVDSIDIFYRKKRINILTLIYCLYTVYYWAIDLFYILKKEKATKVADIYLNEILKYDRKILYLSLLLVYFKKFTVFFKGLLRN